jgi:Intracellular proteinase inhibitor
VAPDSLRRELIAPERARAGRPVEIVLRVTNITARPLDLSLQGREIVFDVAVTNPQGGEVWRRLKGQNVQAILQLKTLAPGEALELRSTWTPPASAHGEHTISADIKTDAAPILFRPARIRIG